MPKWRNRICDSCGAVEFTASKCSTCSTCTVEIKKKNKIAQEKQHLEDLGYQILKEPEMTSTGHRQYSLLPPCCKREFSPTYPNILKQLSRGSATPCRWCGGEKRINKAMQGYLHKYSADYDLNLFAEYGKKVRRLSEQTYKKNKHIINPLNLRRGRTRGTFHLDHKVSVIWCFKNQIPAEVASSVNNLQMLPMEQNLEKGRKNISNEEAQKLLYSSTVSSILNQQVPGWKGRVVHDYENVFDVEQVTIRESEYWKTPDAVISRLKFQLGEAGIRIGARKLELKEVTKDEEKTFLERWHVQGYASSKSALGLYLESELLAVMTFCSPRYKQAIAEYELLRYAVRGGYCIPGAASRLFTSWMKTHNFPSVISYSLNRWGSGKMYEHLGFEKISSSLSPSFIWPDGKHLKWRASVLRAKRTGADLKTLTKIHDPGSTTWLFKGKSI